MVRGDAARDVVVQIQPGGCLPLGLGKPKNLLRVLEEDVTPLLLLIEVNKADVQREGVRPLEIRQTMGCRKFELVGDGAFWI